MAMSERLKEIQAILRAASGVFDPIEEELPEDPPTEEPDKSKDSAMIDFMAQHACRVFQLVKGGGWVVNGFWAPGDEDKLVWLDGEYLTARTAITAAMRQAEDMRSDLS